MKMCILFRYRPQIIFVNFFDKMNVVIFLAVLGTCTCTLCMELLQQFYADSFETVPVFISWTEDVLLFRYITQIFCPFFTG